MKTKTVKKSALKEKNGCYYEFDDFYNKLPETLKVPEYKTEIFPTVMTHREIIEKYSVRPYENIEDAFAVATDVIKTLKNDYKGRIIYFYDSSKTLCRLDVWRYGGGGLSVGVLEVNLDNKWDAGYGVSLSNNVSKTSSASETESLRDFEPLFCPHCSKEVKVKLEK